MPRRGSFSPGGKLEQRPSVERTAGRRPAPSGGERKKRTLTNLYNARPTWLNLAHRKLDAAVLAAYGWPEDLPDEEILERLLRLNLERAEKQGKA